MIDETDFCASGSNYTGTIFRLSVLNGQGLVEGRVNVHAPVARLAEIYP